MNNNQSLYENDNDTAITKPIPQKLSNNFDPYIYEAMERHRFVEFTLYDDYEELKIIGIIDQYDSNTQRVKIDGEWFSLHNVMNVYVNKG